MYLALALALDYPHTNSSWATMDRRGYFAGTLRKSLTSTKQHQPKRIFLIP